ncbi:hypothetical protein KBP30_04585 [Streptomyces sp. Go40/10]|uniref:hypothetical protein n=1 Tax=Streptomyces sp. Go40/10 TaxID=2825844 RepID=UPI001E584C03|nr:hypothetical protein [Streptomyces sp. Go40/10]UFR00500.1 hypothetical protein KBP30_04585 [Streptomyces sp. Go40/10]
MSVHSQNTGSPTRSVALPGNPAARTWVSSWVSSEDGDSVAVWDANMLTLSLYAADDLASHQDVDLARRLHGTAGKSRVESVAQLGDGSLAVLLTTNDVLRVDPATGQVVSAPLRVAEPEPSPPPAFTPHGQLVPHPGHPHQTLAGSLDPGQPRVLFSPDGSLVAVGHSDGKLRFRDAAAGRRTGGVVPYPAGTHTLAFVGDDTLVSMTYDRGIRLHRVSDGGALGEGPETVGPYPFAAAASGSRLRLTTSGQLQGLDLDPAHWWAGLCRAADRPYTTAERRRLPAGAYTHPPLSDVTEPRWHPRDTRRGTAPSGGQPWAHSRACTSSSAVGSGLWPSVHGFTHPQFPQA